jgi:3-deoxy-manno-octulosonate cytidylyltransferase (CMP-KDO synthetase)
VRRAAGTPTGSSSAIAIIPVRLDSQRLPGKAMLAESGRPLFLHTWERAVAATRFAGVWVATDSDEVHAACESGGARVVRTSAAPRTGSERCAEALREFDAGIVVDIQGDWPEVAPNDLDALVDCLRDEPALPTATLAVPLRDPARIADPNVVKVVRDRARNALYFSRAAIPHVRAGHACVRLRHIGVYAFTRASLSRVPELPSSGLAEAEGLEQLRFLENGMAMRVLDATGDPWGIETRADYEAFLTRSRAEDRP